MGMSYSTVNLLEQCRDLDTGGVDFNKDYERAQSAESSAEIPEQFAMSDIIVYLPWRLLLTFGMTTFMIWKYYFDHCEWQSDGRWFASKSMYLPKTTGLSILSTFFPSFFPMPHDDTPFWEFTHD